MMEHFHCDACPPIWQHATCLMWESINFRWFAEERINDGLVARDALSNVIF